MSFRKSSKWWFGGALLLLLVVGMGTAVYTQTIRSLRPALYPNSRPIADAPRCGTVSLKWINNGYNITAYDCYLTTDSPINVYTHHIIDGFDLQENVVFRKQDQQTVVKSSLTHLVNAYQPPNAETTIRVTSSLTVQWGVR